MWHYNKGHLPLLMAFPNTWLNTDFDLITYYMFPYSIHNEYGVPTGDAFISEYQNLCHFGLWHDLMLRPVSSNFSRFRTLSLEHPSVLLFYFELKTDSKFLPELSPAQRLFRTKIELLKHTYQSRITCANIFLRNSILIAIWETQTLTKCLQGL